MLEIIIAAFFAFFVILCIFSSCIIGKKTEKEQEAEDIIQMQYLKNYNKNKKRGGNK